MICLVLGKYFIIHGHCGIYGFLGSDTQPDPANRILGKTITNITPCFDNLPETTLGVPHFALIKELISFANKRGKISRLSIYDFRKWCQHMRQVSPGKQDGKMGPYLLRKRRDCGTRRRSRWTKQVTALKEVIEDTLNFCIPTFRGDTVKLIKINCTLYLF